MVRASVARRALLTALAAAGWPSSRTPALAGSRVTAQSVGLDQPSVGLLADPRAFADGEGLRPLVWGGRERCDPTEASCGAAGKVRRDAPELLPLPRTPLAPRERVALQLSISGEAAGAITLGLDREAGAASVETFLQLCRGTLVSDGADAPASYERSRVARIVRDKAIVLGELTQQGGSLRLVAGRTKPVRFPVRPPLNDDPPNAIRHDQPGLLSVRRGGGSFEFTLTPRANAELDREWLVIGQVVDEASMQLLSRLNNLAVNNYDGAPLAKVQVTAVRVL